MWEGKAKPTPCLLSWRTEGSLPLVIALSRGSSNRFTPKAWFSQEKKKKANIIMVIKDRPASQRP